MTSINIAGGAYISPGISVNSQRCVNMYSIDPGPNGRGKGTLIPTAGLSRLLEITNARTRGLIYVPSVNRIFTVVDGGFYELTPGTPWTYTSRGTITSTSGAVSMATNPTQLMIVDGTSAGYIFTFSSNAFATISDGDFLGGNSVVFNDGYFLYNQIGTGKVFSSALNNGAAWDALDVFTAETSPDNITSLAILHDEVWIFGTDTIEIWYDAANATGSPYSKRVGGGVTIGCRAAASIVTFDDSLVFLDTRGYVVQSAPSQYLVDTSSGSALKILSTDAINKEFSTYSTLADAVACYYNDRGHQMYEITFPTANKSWVYDLATSLWHEKNTYDFNLDVFNKDLTQYVINVPGQGNIVASVDTGIFYKLSHDYLDNAGIQIIRNRTTSPFNQEFNLVGVDRIDLRMGSGIVTSTAAIQDPQINLRYSNDGGHTWSYILPRSMGKGGEYGKMITWNRLGIAREWILEFTIGDACDFSIIDASATTTEIED